MITAFIINLPKAKERKISALNECNKISHFINAEIFPAYDGKEILSKLKNDESLQRKVALQPKTTLNLRLGRKAVMHDALSPSEAGCALSHLKVYEEIIKRNLEFALILEDDIQISEDLNLIIEPLIKNKSKWDIVLVDHLSGIRRSLLPERIQLSTNPQINLNREGMGILDPIFNRRRIAFMASCYFVSKHACKKLLEIGYPARLPADYLLGYPALHGLRLYTIESPTPLAFTNKKEFSSTIGDRPNHRIY